jgi:asparagine synthase (glutamine-hydrolysing)
MCGITGIFNLDPDADVCRETVERMCGVIRHRGPDDQGVYSQGPIGLLGRV